MPTAHDQFPTFTGELAPDTSQYDLAAKIASGLHTPTYEEFVSFGDYVKSFKQAYSSIRDNDDIPTVYVRQNPENPDDTTFLSEEDYKLHAQAAQPGHWRLSRADKADISELLAAKTLAEADKAGRHRSPMATGDTREADAKTLAILQDDAQRRVELDQKIREARIAQLWADSQHGARFGLQGKTLGKAALNTLQSVRSEERFGRNVVPNPFQEEAGPKAQVKQQDARPAAAPAHKEAVPVTNLQRLRKVARSLISSFFA